MPSSAINATFAQDKAAANTLGSAVESASTAMKNAVQSGDQAKIMEAKLEVDKANQNLSLFAASKDKEDDLIMQLIQQLGD